MMYPVCRHRCFQFRHFQGLSKDNSQYLKVKVHPKLLISQNKFSGPRKFILRYQEFEIKGVEM